MVSMTSLISLRAATPADCSAVADLLVQLYAAELPGALSGPQATQRSLLKYTLEAEQYRGLHGRYLALDSDGTIIGTAATRLPGAPPVNRAPAGTLRLAFALLGFRHALHLVGTLARTMVLTSPPLPTHHAYVHGVVVAEGQRGQGWGEQIMLALEASLRDQGVRGIQLQVVLSNTGARRLYQRLGYQLSGRSPRWLDRLTFATETMSKLL
jgi:ribosomal protein S18 acetylase RimI-like enzyme